VIELSKARLVYIAIIACLVVFYLQGTVLIMCGMSDGHD